MKLVLLGRGRRERRHEHEVCEVDYYHRVAKPLEWNGALQASGMVFGLGLTGSFVIQFIFEDCELRNWLHKYVAEKPEAALKLLAEMEAEAIIGLSQRREEPDRITD